MISINYKEISSELTFEGTYEEKGAAYDFYIHESKDDVTIDWGMSKPDLYRSLDYKIIDEFKKKR